MIITPPQSDMYLLDYEMEDTLDHRNEKSKSIKKDSTINIKKKK